MVKTKKVSKYVKYRCRLCNCAITILQKYFDMGICTKCDTDIPEHIPHRQRHNYLLHKILRKLNEKN